MALFSLSELNKLSNVRAKYELATNEYLANPQNENFRFVSKQYFDNNSSDTRLFNTGSGVFFSVCNTISMFTGSPSGEIEINLANQTRDISAVGYSVTALIKTTNAAGEQVRATEYVAPYQYIKRNEEELVLRYYIDTQENSVRYFALVQTFTAGRIENRLYLTNAMTDISVSGNYSEVPLDTIPETSNLKPLVITGMDRSALFVVSVERDIDNNVSTVDKIRNLGYSMDRKLVMMDSQFLMNVESFVLMKGIVLGRKTTERANAGACEKGEFRGRTVITDNPDAKIEFVKNTNDLIKDAKEHITDQLRAVSSITTVPMDFLSGEAVNGDVGQGSRTLLHGAFMKTIESIRKLYDPIIEKMYAAARLEINYEWPESFALPMSELVGAMSEAVKNGLMSQQTGIMKLQGLDGEQLEKEIDRIANDRLLIVSTQINEQGSTDLNDDQTEDEPDDGGAAT